MTKGDFEVVNMPEDKSNINPYPERQGLTFSFFPFLITFVLMFVTWIILSGRFDPLLIGLGCFSSFLVAFFFHNLIFTSTRLQYKHLRIFFRFCKYIPWLMIEITKANFHMLYIIFHPRMIDQIDPHLFDFQVGLNSDISITTLANSITLTPGTITVTANADGRFRVHAIDKSSAETLPGIMGKKVADVYGEKL